MKNIIIILFGLILLFTIITSYSDCDYKFNSLTTITNNYACNEEYLNYLDGYWISNEEFNELSNIDKMILYINYDEKNGYLTIITNNEIISQDELNLNIDDNIQFDKNKLQNMNFKLVFNNKNSNNFIWKNKDFNTILSINNGNLKLFYKDTLYADLYKDNMITSYINEI